MFAAKFRPGKSAIPFLVKSFGRRQASESPRGTNPRCAGRGLWGFDVFAVPGRAVVKRAGLHRGAEGELFELITADVVERWQAISVTVAMICAPDEASDVMGARVVDCRGGIATT